MAVDKVVEGAIMVSLTGSPVATPGVDPGGHWRRSIRGYCRLSLRYSCCSGLSRSSRINTTYCQRISHRYNRFIRRGLGSSCKHSRLVCYLLYLISERRQLLCHILNLLPK